MSDDGDVTNPPQAEWETMHKEVTLKPDGRRMIFYSFSKSEPNDDKEVRA